MNTSARSDYALVCSTILLFGTLTVCRGQIFTLAPAPYIVAQSDYAGQNGNTSAAYIGYPFAQTFTPTTGGTLFSLSAGFYAPEVVAQSYYIFQFRDTTPAGLPDSQVIASVNVSTAPLKSGYGWIDLTGDFSSFGISLDAGHEYALSVDLPGPIRTLQNGFVWGLTGSGYSGGESYYFTTYGDPQLVIPGEDFLFKVQAVPEPSLILPLAAAWLWALRRHARHQGLPGVEQPNSEIC